MKQLKSTYHGKKVFLTGHTGFKGAWLVKILELLGADIKGYALEPKTPDDLYRLINGDKICSSVIADIRDKERLIKEVDLFQPDFIFHLAAQPLVRLSYEITTETYEVNAIGTANLLEAIRSLEKACDVVLITTDKVYHNNEWLYPYRENDRLGGYDPYSASKACAELIIDSYRNCFFPVEEYNFHKKTIAVARAGNVIGGGDWSKDRLMTDVIAALSNNRPILLRNPFSVRPWQHVLEPLNGYLILGQKVNSNPEKYCQAYNFGPNPEDALTVERMTQMAIECWGSGSCQSISAQNQPHEAGLLKLDISKAKAELGWMPRMNAAQSIATTIGWYKQYLNNSKTILDFTTQQIQAFYE